VTFFRCRHAAPTSRSGDAVTRAQRHRWVDRVARSAGPRPAARIAEASTTAASRQASSGRSCSRRRSRERHSGFQPAPRHAQGNARSEVAARRQDHPRTSREFAPSAMRMPISRERWSPNRPSRRRSPAPPERVRPAVHAEARGSAPRAPVRDSPPAARALRALLCAGLGACSGRGEVRRIPRTDASA